MASYILIATTQPQIAHDAVYGEKCIITKACSVDLVTETDKKVEEFIFSTLKEKFPTHKYVDEAKKSTFFRTCFK